MSLSQKKPPVVIIGANALTITPERSLVGLGIGVLLFLGGLALIGKKNSHGRR